MHTSISNDQSIITEDVWELLFVKTHVKNVGDVMIGGFYCPPNQGRI